MIPMINSCLGKYRTAIKKTTFSSNASSAAVGAFPATNAAVARSAEAVLGSSAQAASLF